MERRETTGIQGTKRICFRQMIIAGLQKHTLIDYPGKVAATIFISGCNFKCPFCHNPELVLPEEIKKGKELPLKEVFAFLEERKGFLDGVVICGGEPTIHSDLDNFIFKIKKMGFLIKLDTNGYNPEMLEKLIDKKLVDYIAMDIKASKEKYNKLAGARVDLQKIEQSIGLLKNRAKDYEFRTTLVPGMIEKEDILKIVLWIAPAKKYVIQNFSNKQMLVNKELSSKNPFSDECLESVKKEVESFFDICETR